MNARCFPLFDVQPKKLPMVLRIHGGPWYRDWWGWDDENQFWATRGYGLYLQESFSLLLTIVLGSRFL